MRLGRCCGPVAEFIASERAQRLGMACHVNRLPLQPRCQQARSACCRHLPPHRATAAWRMGAVRLGDIRRHAHSLELPLPAACITDRSDRWAAAADGCAADAPGGDWPGTGRRTAWAVAAPRWRTCPWAIAVTGRNA